MFKAFFDEASDNTDDFLMGGWLARFDEWEKFSEAWDKELKFAPSINYFNHNEATGNKDEFEGWSDSDRDGKMEALANVLARYDLVGLVGRIEIPELSALFENSILPKRKLRSIVKFTEPYHHACQCVVAGTLGYQILKARNLIDRVDFIFDDGVPFLDDIIGNYPRLKNVLPPEDVKIAGTIVPENDKQVVALQAADLLVGQKLLELRLKTKPKPLMFIENKIEPTFSCQGPALSTIPISISKLNVAWATKQLGDIQDRKRRKSEYERKKRGV